MLFTTVEPLEAVSILPCISTSIVGFTYVPGLTPLSFKLIVGVNDPEEIIGTVAFTAVTP